MENVCERFDRVEVLHRYGTQQLAQKNYAAAAVTFSRAIHLQPDHAPVWYGQGDALANLHRYAEALESFDRAIALAPDNAAAWTFRGVVLLHLDRPAEALQSCDRALELCSDDARAWTFRGAALQRLGKYNQAYKSFGAATPVLATSPPWWQQLRPYQRGRSMWLVALRRQQAQTRHWVRRTLALLHRLISF